MTKTKSSFWQRMGFHDWFLKREIEYTTHQTQPLTTDEIYQYIVDKFENSIKELSFANRIVFFHEYIVCFNQEDYNQFTQNKNGIFGLIVQESVKKFYDILNQEIQNGKTVAPSSNKWVFRFVAHPEYLRGDKSLIGKLMPGSTQPKNENLRITFIPRQTGIAETFDVNPELLDGFIFYSDGYYEVAYDNHLMSPDHSVTSVNGKVVARLETIIPDREYAGKKIEYFMKDKEITVSGKDENKEQSNIFRIPSEWVNTPHLKIRYDDKDDSFYLASYGEKTIVNETQIPSSNHNDLKWVRLPLNSRIVLNGIVGVNIFKS
ncbi:MAG: hypothetical protein JST21_11655 [Bacteroidetes bacterium]|nr:hypothetical protein [Bacteroidota bacterium]